MPKIGKCSTCPIVRLEWRIDATYDGEYSHSEHFHTKAEAQCAMRNLREYYYDARLFKVKTRSWCKQCTKVKGTADAAQQDTHTNVYMVTACHDMEYVPTAIFKTEHKAKLFKEQVLDGVDSRVLKVELLDNKYNGERLYFVRVNSVDSKATECYLSKHFYDDLLNTVKFDVNGHYYVHVFAYGAKQAKFEAELLVAQHKSRVQF